MYYIISPSLRVELIHPMLKTACPRFVSGLLKSTVVTTKLPSTSTIMRTVGCEFSPPATALFAILVEKPS